MHETFISALIVLHNHIFNGGGGLHPPGVPCSRRWSAVVHAFIILLRLAATNFEKDYNYLKETVSQVVFNRVL